MPIHRPDGDAELGCEGSLGNIGVLLDLLEQGEFALVFCLHGFIIQSLNYNPFRVGGKRARSLI